MEHAPQRRALVVGVQHPLDLEQPRRPGTCAALRRVADALERGGWAVRALLDDADEDSQRPLFANLLDGLQWLQNSTALLVLSAPVVDGRVLPRDGRADQPRTTLPLTEVVDALAGATLWLDGAALATPGRLAGWMAAPVAVGEGSPFLRALAGALIPGPYPLTAEACLAGLHARMAEPPQVGGTLLEPVLFAAPTRACSTCQALVPDARAVFCPSCGAALRVRELLDNGRFRLLDRLGAGGMGQVFLAEDTRLKVRRAIKLLAVPASLPAEDRALLQARLVQEARAAQTLSDLTPHVVRVFDVGHAPERGEPYLVMELLDGETLGARLTRDRLAFNDALAIGRVAAEALAVAHARGFVHRDLKPDNLMLCRREPIESTAQSAPASFVKVLDFGLVKAEQAEVKTESGRMMGTLQYMPPEQLRGQAVDARADVFSLGAVLYECFSGQRANPGHTQAEIFAVLLDRGVLPLAQVAPELPRSLTALIDACLSLDPTKRPPHAGAVAAALARIQPPVGAAPSVFALTLPSADVQAIPTDDRAPPDRGPESDMEVPPGLRRAARWPWALGVAVLGIGASVAFWPHGASVDARDAAPIRDAAPPSAPVRDAAAPPAPVDAHVAPAAVPLTLPAEVEARPDVQRTFEGTGGDPHTWTRYTGTPTAIASAVVRDVALGATAPLIDVELETRWAALPPVVRRWLAEGVALEGLVVEAGSVRVPTERFTQKARATRTILNGIGTFWSDGARAPVAEAARCARLAVGDTVVAARWTMPGYSGGQCSADACIDKLERAVQKARSVGERLTVTLTLARGGDGGERLDIGCALAP